MSENRVWLFKRIEDSNPKTQLLHAFVQRRQFFSVSTLVKVNPNMIRNSGRTQRCGFTLTEVLIAMSITLLILLAMMRAFTVASKDIAQGRNRLILAERMQTASDLIREDLEQLSLGVEPIVAVDKDLGYFEYVDGPFRDMTFANVPNNSTLGDFDDVIAFTVKSQGEAFRGRMLVQVDNGPDTTANTVDDIWTNTIIESQEAEVIYFTSWTDTDLSGGITYGDQIRLYRRVLLIRPDINNIPQVVFASRVRFNSENGSAPVDSFRADRSDYAKFLQYNDISLRLDRSATEFEYPGSPAAPIWTTDHLVPNSLGTATHPMNRTAHSHYFPFAMKVNDQPLVAAELPHANFLETRVSDLILAGTNAGNDVVLENVTGFDVKIFDSTAGVYSYAGMPLTPKDSGYKAIWSTAAAVPDGFGAYVDLGFAEYRNINGVPVAAVSGDAEFIGNVDAYKFGYWNSHGFRARDISSAPAAGYFPRIVSGDVGLPFGRHCYNLHANGPTYTTWPDSFEYDGIDNDVDGEVDEGADGIAIGTPVPDLFNDKDSAPPYSYPVDSVQVTLRTASFDADRQKISASDQVIQSQVVVSTTNQ